MRALVVALLTLAWLSPSCAPAPTSEPAIWRIADADSEIWLFGSVHLLPPELRWRGPRMRSAFAAAEELWTETDAGPEAEAAFPELLQLHGALPAGETLAGRVGAEEMQRVADAAAALNLDPAAFDRQRPWLTALQLSTAYAVRAGHRPEAGVEAVLDAEARARGMRLLHFETLEQQVRVLADLSPADEARLLTVTLRELDEDASGLAALDQAWARGDVEELARQLEGQWREAGPGVHNAVILARNRRWADAIEVRLAGAGRTFIAVGAAHLVGEGSVVALLRQRGIEVEGP